MHSTYSDGLYSVPELLDIMKENNMSVIAITDHNSIEAHKEIKNKNLKAKYPMQIINGAEIQTKVGGYVVEVLAYNFDIDKFSLYVNKCQEKFWNYHKKAYEKLLQVASKMGLNYQEPSKPLGNDYFANMRFQDAIKACYEENSIKVDDKILLDHTYFYCHEFQNPESPFFIDNSEAFPEINELITSVHMCGGLCFLAHIDEYQAIADKMAFLDYLTQHTDIDRIECYHPVFTKEQSQKYASYAKSHHLLTSGGSDFHGPNFKERNEISVPINEDDITWLKDLEIK